MSESPESTGLIRCEACSREISTLAAQCPGCGAPNTWIHPDIRKFIDAKDKINTVAKFEFQYNKVEIWGTSVSTVKWWFWVVTGILVFAGFVFGVVPGLIFVGIAWYIIEKKKQQFRANLQDRTWQSSNDEFWRPVKAALNL